MFNGASSAIDQSSAGHDELSTITQKSGLRFWEVIHDLENSYAHRRFLVGVHATIIVGLKLIVRKLANVMSARRTTRVLREPLTQALLVETVTAMPDTRHVHGTNLFLADDARSFRRRGLNLNCPLNLLSRRANNYWIKKVTTEVEVQRDVEDHMPSTGRNARRRGFEIGTQQSQYLAYVSFMGKNHIVSRCRIKIPDVAVELSIRKSDGVDHLQNINHFVCHSLISPEYINGSN
jgi:hypothetical protein